jgi:hypothetical protein
LYHRVVGSLKTSEQGDSIAGEGNKDPTADDRPVDTGAKIIIDPGGRSESGHLHFGPGTLDASPAPTPRVVAPLAPRPNRPSQMPLPEPRQSLGLIILLYVMSAAALAFAIYERFLA